MDPSLLENLQDISLKAACADSFYYPQVPREGGGMESGQSDINCKGGKLQTVAIHYGSFFSSNSFCKRVPTSSLGVGDAIWALRW